MKNLFVSLLGMVCVVYLSWSLDMDLTERGEDLFFTSLYAILVGAAFLVVPPYE